MIHLEIMTMDQRTVRGTAFAMPLTNPAFPPGLARLGANIVVNGLGDAGEIEATRSGLERNHRVRADYDRADMSDGEAVRGLIGATVERFGRLDILVNNAGIQFTAPVEEFPPAKWHSIWRSIYRLHSTATRQLCRR
jgi:NAD(P)-dependent dehydrogenase (short-subunit alcohol dehydrogenase family)